MPRCIDGSYSLAKKASSLPSNADGVALQPRPITKRLLETRYSSSLSMVANENGANLYPEPE